MFTQIFKQSEEIKLIPNKDGTFKVICLTKLNDGEEKYDAEFTFPTVRLNISGDVLESGNELFFVKVLDE